MLSRQQVQKRPITAVDRKTSRTPDQVFLHQNRLFRVELTIQIFPQPAQDLFTIHPLHPRETRPPRWDAAHQNRGEAPRVPDRRWPAKETQ